MTRIAKINFMAFLPLILLATNVQAEPIVDNEDDGLVNMLRMLLGDVVNVISGGELPESPDSLLGLMFRYWNTTLLTVVTGLIGWVLFSVFFSALHGGKDNKDIDTASLSARIIIGLTMCVPLGSGFCAVQILHIHIAGYSIQAANDLADIYYENIRGGAILTSGNGFKELDVPTALYESNFCTELAYRLADRDVEYRVATETAIRVEQVNSMPRQTKYAFKYDEPGVFESFAECGEYSIAYQSAYSKYSDGQGEATATQSYMDLLDSMHAKTNQMAATFVDRLIANPDEANLASLIQNERQQLSQLRIDFKEETKSIYEEYLRELQRYSNNPDNQASPFDNFAPEELGAIAVGATYWMVSLRTQYINDTIRNIEVDMNRVMDSELLAEKSLARGWKSLASITKDLGGILSETNDGSASTKQSYENAADSFVVSSRNIIFEGGDPLFAAMDLGHTLIGFGESIAGVIMLANIAGESLKGQNEGVVSNLFGFLGSLRGIVIGTLKTLAQGLTALMIPLILMGGFLAFWIPTLPLLHWISAVMSSVIGVTMGFILAPIHALAHVFSGGRGMIGQRAAQGYVLLFGAYVRFPLMVISFLISYLMLLAGGWLIFTLWLPAANAMTADSWTGLLSWLFLIIVFMALLNNMIERVFTLMTEINDTAMKMLGHGAEQLVGLQSSQVQSSFQESSRHLGTGVQGMTSSAQKPSTGSVA